MNQNDIAVGGIKANTARYPVINWR